MFSWATLFFDTIATFACISMQLMRCLLALPHSYQGARGPHRHTRSYMSAGRDLWTRKKGGGEWGGGVTSRDVDLHRLAEAKQPGAGGSSSTSAYHRCMHVHAQQRTSTATSMPSEPNHHRSKTSISRPGRGKRTSCALGGHFRYFRSLLCLSCRSGEPTWGDTDPDRQTLAGLRWHCEELRMRELSKLFAWARAGGGLGRPCRRTRTRRSHAGDGYRSPPSSCCPSARST